VDLEIGCPLAEIAQIERIDLDGIDAGGVARSTQIFSRGVPGWRKG